MWTSPRKLLLKRFAVFFGLWLVLTHAEPAGIAFGLVASAASVWTSTRLAPQNQRRLRLLRLAALAPAYFSRALRGGLDVARRAFHPKLPLNPGWIAYSARLPTGAPRVFLGGELSLMPGTLVAGTADGRLLVHCLDTDLPIARQVAREEDRLQGAVEP